MTSKIQKSCTCSGCNLWLILEAERLDLSYRKHPAAQASIEPPRMVTKAKQETARERDERDKLMFNAGRYAEGARDKSAVKADQLLAQEIEKENR